MFSGIDDMVPTFLTAISLCFAIRILADFPSAFLQSPLKLNFPSQRHILILFCYGILSSSSSIPIPLRRVSQQKPTGKQKNKKRNLNTMLVRYLFDCLPSGNIGRYIMQESSVD